MGPRAQLYGKRLKDRATNFKQQAKVVENRNTKGVEIWRHLVENWQQNLQVLNLGPRLRSHLGKVVTMKLEL